MATLDLATLGSLGTAAAVIVALVFGIVQVRDGRRKRREDATVNALTVLTTVEFARMWQHFRSFPPKIGVKELRAMDPDTRLAWTYFNALTENWGLLVHERVLDLDFLDRATGDVILGIWAKAKEDIVETRATLGSDDVLEWTQWLAERIAARRHERHHKPAYAAFADWKE
jgi:hypothetical protein